MGLLLPKPVVQGFLAPSTAALGPTGYIDRASGQIVGIYNGEQSLTLLNISSGAVVTDQNVFSQGVNINEQYALIAAPDGKLWVYNSSPATILELVRMDPTVSPWAIPESWGSGGIPTGMSTLPFQFAWLQIGNGGWIVSSDGTSTSTMEVFQANPGGIGFWGHSFEASANTDAGVCAGPQSAASGTAYWVGQEGKLGQTVIQASALLYDPSTWPTPNSGIVSTAIKTYAPSDFDSHWGAITVMYGPAYDQTDGNVIVQVEGSGGGNANYLAKLKTTDGTVMWKVPVASTSGFFAGIAQSRIAVGNFLYHDATGTLHVINTGSGADATSSVTGALSHINNQASDDVMGCIFGQAQWDNSGGGLILLNATHTTGNTLAAVYFIQQAPPPSGGAIGYTRMFGLW